MSPPNARSAARLGLLLALSAAASLAWAKSTDRNQPMDVDADSVEGALVDDGETTLTGNVHITQGTLDARSDTVVIHRAKGEIARAVFKGKPARLKQINDDGGTMNARAATIDYDVIKEIAVLTGDVEVVQPQGTMRGERLVYNIGTGHVDGGGSGSRVKLRIEPKDKQPAKKGETGQTDAAKPAKSGGN